MANNTNKTDSLHNELPANVFKTKVNPNWKAIVEAVGTQDQFTADLIEEVKRQLFLKTASGRYLSYIGASNKLERPRLIGLSDALYRRYVSILANNPKQVKAIVDNILDLFYEKAATYAYCGSANAGPYILQDGDYLEVEIDRDRSVTVEFVSEDFEDITAATAKEVALAINKKYEEIFAEVKLDYATNLSYVRIFTKTQGFDGFAKVLGGSAANAFAFEGFLYASPSTTQWTVTKTGDLIKFTRSGGATPDLSTVFKDDYVSISLSGNSGVFILEDINDSDKTFTFRNLLGTAGSFTQTSAAQVTFTRPEKKRVWHRSRRALTWQPSTGSFDVELPNTPILTRTKMQGSSYINGRSGGILERVSSSSLRLNVDLTDWPSEGEFFLIGNKGHVVRLDSADGQETVTSSTNSTFDHLARYSYTGKTSDTLTGISPSLPTVAALHIRTLSVISDLSTGYLTGVTTTAHGFAVGDNVGITGITTNEIFNGCWPVTQIVNSTTFKVKVPFSVSQYIYTEGEARVEREGFIVSGSSVILSESLSGEVTGVKGSYLWDPRFAKFVVSSQKATGPVITQLVGGVATTKEIKTGDTAITLSFDESDLPESGLIVFDYGLNTQEGPIAYTKTLTDGSILLDSSYIFRYPHDTETSTVNAINQLGPRQLEGNELAPYIADPAIVRTLLEQLIEDVKSTGIFANIIVSST